MDIKIRRKKNCKKKKEGSEGDKKNRREKFKDKNVKDGADRLERNGRKWSERDKTPGGGYKRIHMIRGVQQKKGFLRKGSWEEGDTTMKTKTWNAANCSKSNLNKTRRNSMRNRKGNVSDNSKHELKMMQMRKVNAKKEGNIDVLAVEKGDDSKKTTSGGPG